MDKSLDCEQLKLQLSEIELLSSMYPGEGEFSVEDGSLIHNMQRYIEGKRQAVPNELSYNISLHLEDPKCNIDVSCSYPLQYPLVLPNVFVRCHAMSRSSQTHFNQELRSYMSSLDNGELCMSSVILWVTENIVLYINNPGISDTNSSCAQPEYKYTGFSRLWIYSHHIYRKELLKKISESAKELDLTGFCLPGKPGIICVEGIKENCDRYWQKVKYPNWKHISCKHRDDKQFEKSGSVQGQLAEFRVFTTFEELSFEAHGTYGLRNDYHMDLGQFRQYLDKHGCMNMFQIFFGLDAK